MLPDFDDIADALSASSALESPSELHGYLCGQLVHGQIPQPQVWLAQVAQYLNIDMAELRQPELWQSLLEETEAQLSADEYELRLVLPDEDTYDQAERADSLACWCVGFLAGFALGGKERQKTSGKAEYSDTVSETLSDLVAISQLGHEGLDGDEETEKQLFSVSEYLRMAVLGLALECGAGSPPPTSGKVH